MRFIAASGSWFSLPVQCARIASFQQSELGRLLDVHVDRDFATRLQ